MKVEIGKYYTGKKEAKACFKSVFNVSQTAQVLGITEQQVKRLIETGQLSARLLFNHFYIVIGELNRYLKIVSKIE